MPRHNVPLRVEAVLACIAPLTPEQLARALDYNPKNIGPQVFYMLRAGRVQRVPASRAQRQQNGNVTVAYALGER